MALPRVTGDAQARPAFRPVSARRRVWGAAMKGITALAAALAVFPLIDILVLVIARGLKALGPPVFFTVTNGESGGLQNAILGTGWLLAMATLLAGPIGVVSGIYLAEWSSRRTGFLLRYLSDVLTGVPSIVVGYFLYVALVTSSGLGWGFSSLAGAIALAVIMLPYIVRTTELALRKVPLELREGGLALGVSHVGTIVRIELPVAAGGILTGVLLAMGIGLGETAPLLYTAGWSSFNPTLALTHSPVGYLTYVVWTFINEPFATAQNLAYTAALLLMVGVLALNLVARWILARQERGLRA